MLTSGKAEKALVRTHKAEIAGAGDDRTVAKRMAVNGRNNRYRIKKQFFKNHIHFVDEIRYRLMFIFLHLSHNPFNIYTLRKILWVIGRNNQSGYGFIRDYFIKHRIQCLGKCQILSVFAIRHGYNGDGLIFGPVHDRHVFLPLSFKMYKLRSQRL